MLTRAKNSIQKPNLDFLLWLSLPRLLFQIPFYYKEAQWKTAMRVDYEAPFKNHTWTLVPLPPSKNKIGSK